MESIYLGEGRGDLLRLNPDLVTAKVTDVLRAFPEVLGAYLFGSALDYVRPDSDIDLGVILDAALLAPAVGGWLAPDEVASDNMERRLGRLGSHPFQVTVLREEQTGFVLPILHAGRLLYCANYPKLTDFIERVARLYAHDLPHLLTFHRVQAEMLGDLYE